MVADTIPRVTVRHDKWKEREMKNKYTAFTMCFVAGLIVAIQIGCKKQSEARFVYGPGDSSIQYSWKRATDNRLDRHEVAIARLEASASFEPRSIPSDSTSYQSRGLVEVSYKTQGELEPDPIAPAPTADEIANAMKSVVEQAVEGAIKETQSRNVTPQYSAPPAQYSAPPVQAESFSSTPSTTYSSPQTFSSPQTYASGPKTYGNARTAGTKTETKYQTRTRVVTEQVPVQVQVPVMKRDVYQTVQEQVPVQVQKTRMKTVMQSRQVPKTVMTTETRTRTKMVPVQEQYSVQVPKTVVETEQYATQVPETYTDTVMQTRSKQVKVGEEEVAAPTPSYSAPAPTPSYSSAPPVQYAAAPQECCEPVQSYQTAPAPAPTPTYSQAVECLPEPMQSFAQPIYQTAQAIVEPVMQAYSAPSASPTTQYASSSQPCAPNTFSSSGPKARPTFLQRRRADNAAYSSSQAAPIRPFKSIANALTKPVQSFASRQPAQTGTFSSAGPTYNTSSLNGVKLICDD